MRGSKTSGGGGCGGWSSHSNEGTPGAFKPENEWELGGFLFFLALKMLIQLRFLDGVPRQDDVKDKIAFFVRDFMGHTRFSFRVRGIGMNIPTIEMLLNLPNRILH